MAELPKLGGHARDVLVDIVRLRPRKGRDQTDAKAHLQSSLAGRSSRSYSDPVGPLDRRELLERTGRLALGAGLQPPRSPGSPRSQLRKRAGRSGISPGSCDGSVVTPANGAYAQDKLLFNTRFDCIAPASDRVLRVGGGRPEDRPVGAQARHADRGAVRRPLVRWLLDDERSRGRRYAHEARAGAKRLGDGGSRRSLDRRLRAVGGKRQSTIPAGSCPSVGIAGLTLGGGASYAGREVRPHLRQRSRSLHRHRPGEARSTALPTNILISSGPVAAEAAGTSGS